MKCGEISLFLYIITFHIKELGNVKVNVRQPRHSEPPKQSDVCEMEDLCLKLDSEKGNTMQRVSTLNE